MPKITENKLTITGKSGKLYEFNIYSIDTKFKTVGGIYIFIKRYKYIRNRDLIYCGKTEDLSNRFYNHHKEDDIVEENPDYICVMRVNTDEERTSIEKDILKGNNFTCNEMLN
jgi:hypothetical protein